MRAARMLALATVVAGCLGGQGTGALVLGTTTSLDDSGLLAVLLPAFEAATGERVRAVIGGTGEVHAKALRGDVDLLLTHAPERERALIREGWASERVPVLSSRFLMAGPVDDPAGVARAANAMDAMLRIRDNTSLFVSRGDQSGTHEKELALWADAGIDPRGLPTSMYKETGSGQGTTLLVADELAAYLLIDEPTLVQFHAAGRASTTQPLFRDDPTLVNPYAVVLLDPTRIAAAAEHGPAARRFADWLAGPAGQQVIRDFTIAGQRVFTSDAEAPTP